MIHKDRVSDRVRAARRERETAVAWIVIGIELPLDSVRIKPSPSAQIMFEGEPFG